MPKKLSMAAQEAGTAAQEAIERALDKHLSGHEKFAMRMLALLVVAASVFAKGECPGCRKKRLDGPSISCAVWSPRTTTPAGGTCTERNRQ